MDTELYRIESELSEKFWDTIDFIEYGFVLEDENKVVLDIRPGTGGCCVARHEHSLLKDNIITHNHLDGPPWVKPEDRDIWKSISFQDIATGANLEVREIRAVFPDHVIRLQRPENGWPEGIREHMSRMAWAMPCHNREDVQKELSAFGLQMEKVKIGEI